MKKTVILSLTGVLLLLLTLSGCNGLKFFQGQEGSAGSVWHVGAGAPPLFIGIVSDHYLDTVTGDAYTRDRDGWALTSNLQGPEGAAGSSGMDGLTWYTGSGIPDGGSGTDGDLFLDTDNGNMYENQGGSWAFVSNLEGPAGIQGDQGIQGPAGATWITDSGIPDPASGSNGDLYLDTASQDIYEKITGSWVYLANILGAPGVQGPQGVAGATWLTGSGGPAPAAGEEGDLYLDTGSQDIYEKITGSWVYIANILGAQGSPGNIWLTGSGLPAPASGAEGDLYLNTDNANVYQKSAGVWNYHTNIQGIAGPAGADGNAGAAGPQGADGSDGATWLSGTSLPDPSVQAEGDLFLDTATANVYLLDTGAWTYVMNITGNSQFQITVQVESGGNPVSGADVLIEAAFQGVSDDDGTFTVYFDTPATVNLNAEKKFFLPGGLSVTLPDDDGITVILNLTPQIFIPDTGNMQIVRIDDMDGANRTDVVDIPGHTLRGPTWVEVDYERGYIYIVDFDNNWDMDETDTGNAYLIRIEDYPNPSANQTVVIPINYGGEGAFDWLSQISLTPSGGFYLTDTMNALILYFTGIIDPSGGIESYNLAPAGTIGGVAVLPNGKIAYSVSGFDVSDIRTVWNIYSASEQPFLADDDGYITGAPGGPNDFYGPTRLIATDTKLFISDSGDYSTGEPGISNSRIISYDLDGTTASRQEFGMQGAGIEEFDHPLLLGHLPDGLLYIMDVVNGRLVRIAPDFDPASWMEYDPSSHAQPLFAFEYYNYVESGQLLP
jgi:hypothetical protein